MIGRFFPPALSRYLGRTYILGFLGLLFVLLGIVYLFDTVELYRRASKFSDVPLSLVLQMGLLKLPEVGQIILPFAVLFSAMMTFWSLSRRSELVILRSAGLSAWQFLAPVIGAALLIGTIQITVINPFSALSLSRFEALETTHLKRSENLISFSGQGLWLKQGTEDGYVILHARNVAMPEWKLQKTTALFFDGENKFIRRIDAPQASLESGQWSFENAVVNTPGKKPMRSDYLSLATDLTIPDIEESFADPQTIPFWRLGRFIEILETTGFDSTAVRIHRQSLLAQPILLMAMVLLAAAVSLRPQRSGGTGTLIAAGIIIGFIVFLGSSFLQALGASGQLPPLLAAWFAPLIALTLGVGAIMSLEDG